MSRLSVPELVQLIREHAGLTQEGLARELGVSFATVNAWERGRSTPRSQHVEALGAMADRLGISRGVGVLVIDDDPISCTVLESLVNNAGVPAEAITAENGSEGLVLCGVHRPDLVLLDVFMPGIDGLEVSERLGQVPGLEHTKVVFITASTDQELHRRIAASGRELLVKPIQQSDIVTLLERLTAEAVARKREDQIAS